MRWTEIEQSDRWKTLTDDQRRAARERYFDEFVAPKAPKHFDPEELRTKWMSPYAAPVEPEEAAEPDGRSAGGYVQDRLLGIGKTGLGMIGTVTDAANRDFGAGFLNPVVGAARDAYALAGKWSPRAKALSDAITAREKPASEFAASFADKAQEYAAEAGGAQSDEEKRNQAETSAAMQEGPLVAAGYLFANPMRAADTLVDSAPYMAAGGAVGGAVARVGGTANAILGANLGTSGALMTEGSGADARQAVAERLAATPEDKIVEQFPDYPGLAAQHGPDEAKRILAERAAGAARAAGTVINTATLGLGSKLAVGERLLSGTLRPGASASRMSNAGRGLVSDAVQEGTEEVGEGAATLLGESSARPSTDLTEGLASRGVMGTFAGAPGGAAGGFMQTPAEKNRPTLQPTPAEKGAADATKAVADANLGLVVNPVDGYTDEDAKLDDLLAAREAESAVAIPGGGSEVAAADAQSPLSADPNLGSSEPDLTAEAYDRARRDIRRSETMQRAESGVPVEQLVPQDPQVTVVQTQDSMRSRRDAARARNDFSAYLDEHGVDMAESDRLSNFEGDRIPQPSGEPVTVGESRISGKGIIATAPIVKPITLFDTTMAGPSRTDAGRFVNHSPQPNADVKLVQGRIIAVPNRPIETGQEVTINYREIDPLRDQLANSQYVPEPTPVNPTDYRSTAQADPEKNPEAFGLPKPLKPRRLKRTPADFDENYDDAMDFLALNGGLNRKAWVSEGVDPDMLTRKKGNDHQRRFGLGPTLFPASGGMTPSEAREKLQGMGFLSPDPDNATATVEDDDAVQMVMESINQGRKFLLPAGAEVEQRAADITRMADSASRDVKVMDELGLKDRDIDEANEFDNRERIQFSQLKPASQSEAFRGMTREQFLGDPRITRDSNAADLKPKVLDTVRDSEPVPFAVGEGLTARYSPDGAAVYDGGNVIASYNFGDTLVVEKKRRRQGIGEELVYQWRTRYPDAKPAASRTKSSQSLQEKVWRRIQREQSRIMFSQPEGIESNEISQDEFDSLMREQRARMTERENERMASMAPDEFTRGVEFSQPSSADTSNPRGEGVGFAHGQEALASRLVQWSSALRLGRAGPRPMEQRPESIGAVNRNAAGAAEQGDATREAIREQSARLIEQAKAGGYYWPNGSQILAEIGKLQTLGGAEHQVFLAGDVDSGNGFVIRATDNGFFGPRSDISPAQYLARLDDYSATFPDLQTRLIGISESPDIPGHAVIWSAQPFVRGKKFRNQRELAEAMAAHGWDVDGNEGDPRFIHRENGAIIEDAHTDNVFQGDNGDLYPFDVVVEALPRQSADGGKAYPRTRSVTDLRNDPQYSQSVGRKVASPASRASDRQAPSPSGIPRGLESKPSLATNKLSSVISKFLGKPYRAEQVVLPDAVSGPLQDFGRLFGRSVVVFRTKDGRLNANGLVLGDGSIYVNENAQSPVLTIASHELLHEIRQSRPELYDFIRKEVEKRADFAKWKAEIDSRELTKGDNRLSDDKVMEELVADSFGDALTDPEFLALLAKRNPSKFRQFVMSALDFFRDIAKKMGKVKSLGSHQYLRDVEGLRDAYAQMLEDFTNGVAPDGSAIGTPEPQLSQARSEEPFYSALARSIEDAKGAPKRATADAWSQWLDGAQRRGEFKQSERDWIGVDAWLRGRDSTTRDELTEFVRANQVDVQETVLGIVSKNTGEEARRQELQRMSLADLHDEAREYDIDPDSGNRADIVDAIIREERGNDDDTAGSNGRTKFASYQTPGGTNYRELLLTLPPAGEKTFQFVVKEGGGRAFRFNGVDYATEREARAAEKSARAKEYHSTHFGEPNILAHVRFNERTDADGKRVLFVEEVQSDWHQAGRKNGYAGAAPPAGEVYEDDGRWRLRSISDKTVWFDSEKEAADFYGSKGVPDAPLKKEWPLTAMKRMIRYASENGFDRIAWTTGDQQAERYDLSKHIDMIEYRAYGDGTYQMSAMRRGSEVLDERNVTIERIAEVVGKEIAEKIERGEGARGVDGAGRKIGQLSGLQLKVGGEGMRAFYDKMLPNELGKYVKKWGGKVGSTKIAETGGAIVVHNVPVHSLDITPSMRESAMQGQPLFSQPKAPAQAAAENAQKRATVGAATGAQQPITFTYGDHFGSDIKGRLNKTRVVMQDKMLSALFVQNDIEAARGAIEDAVNVYRRENLMHGRTGDRLEQLKRRQVDPLVKAIKAEGLDSEVVEDYLEAKFAPERNKIIAAKNPSMPDGGSGMTDAEAADFLAGRTDGLRSGRKIDKADLAKLAKIGNLIQSLRNETLDRLESSGQIDAAAKAAMIAQAPNYVPLRGKDGAEITGGRGSGKGIDVRGRPIKEAMGRGAGNRAINILAEVVVDAERSIIEAEKLRVGKTLARLVLENPNPDLWDVEPVRTEQKVDSVGQVYQAVMPNAQDQDAIRIMHNGKPYFVRLADPKLRDAMKNLGADNSGAIIRFMGGINRYFSAILTRYNPSFISVNALRDLGFGMTSIASEHGTKIAASSAAKYPAAMRAMWRDNRNALGNSTMDRYAREFSEAGARTFFAKRDSVEEMSGKIAAEFKSYGNLLRGGNIGLAINKAVNNSSLLKVVNDANDAVENAMRLSAYAALRESGKSAEQAAEYAKNITVNFNRKGQAAAGINAVILFYNAATQGAHRSILLLKNPKVMAAVGGMAGLQALLAAYAMGADDEDEDGLTAWEKIPDYEKERNLIIPIVGHDANGKRRIRMVKWPMPYGFNVFTYAGGKMAELGMSKEPKPTKFANDMGGAVVNAFSPIKFIDGMDGIKPHFMKIFDALGANKDDLGFPIRDENQFAPFEEPRASMGKADTPEAYKAAAKALNRLGGGDEVTPPKIMRGLLDWAPEDLEYLTEQLTGGIGRFASDSYGVGEKLFAGIDTNPKDYPILRSLVSEVDTNRATAGIYYDRKETIEREKARLKLKFKEDGLAAARTIVSETPALQGFRLKRFKSTGKYTDKAGNVELEAATGSQADAYKAADKRVRDLNAQIREAQAASYPSLKAKVEKIRGLQAEREKAQSEFNAVYAKRRQ